MMHRGFWQRMMFTSFKTPRCITVAEPQLDAVFLLSDPERHVYRCAYCDTAKGKKKGV